MDIGVSTAPGVGQNSVLDITSLPADHTPKFLAEAKRIFETNRPPFVTSFTNKYAEGSKRSVFIAENGQRPILPIRTDLVAKYWGPLARNGLYWTLDLNNERFIVQAFPNKGCVSGAKYVYCCWKGVGEEFEDLPLAFTCIHGDYQNTPGPRTKSTLVAHQLTGKKHTITDAIAQNLHPEHPGHIRPLFEDHPVEFLDDAKAFYVNTRPPFVVQKTKKHIRRVLLATQDGQFSATSTEAEVVYRKWDSANDCPTLDLDGKRFIVWGNAGGGWGGYQYRLWLGSKAGRSKKVVAFISQYVDGKKPISALTEHLSEDEKDSPSSSDGDSGEENHDPREVATETQQYFYNDFKKGFDLTAIPPPKPSRFHTCQSIASPESSARKDHPRRSFTPTKRARSPTPPVHIGSGKGKAPAHASKRTSHHRQFSGDSSHLSSLPYNNNIPTPTPSIDDGAVSATIRAIPEMGNSQTQPSASLPTLSLYKQTHTTLRTTRDSSIISFVPLRLLTCMTMSALFSSVIAASRHREEEEPINCLMAVFDWMEDDEVYKTICIDRGTEGSFEIFLELIDEAPCWGKEGGKCGIAVEVVRA